MILSNIWSILIMLIISACLAYLYQRFKEYKYLGNIYGGIIIAFIGAILLNYMMIPVDLFFKNNFKINFLAVILGAIIFLKILNKTTPR